MDRLPLGEANPRLRKVGLPTAEGFDQQSSAHGLRYNGNLLILNSVQFFSAAEGGMFNVNGASNFNYSDDDVGSTLTIVPGQYNRQRLSDRRVWKLRQFVEFLLFRHVGHHDGLVSPRPHRRCRYARPAFSERGFSRLAATP